jgi:hypothetical protein
LPCHCYGQYHTSILDHEDFAQDIQLHLTEIVKEGYIHAQDVVDNVATPHMQEHLGSKARGISLRTAHHWLKKLDWQHGWKKNSMYIDGHEREDLVKYRKEFLVRWKEYEKRMVTYNNDGNINFTPTGFPVPQGSCFQLILVTHDELTFFGCVVGIVGMASASSSSSLSTNGRLFSEDGRFSLLDIVAETERGYVPGTQ